MHTLRLLWAAHIDEMRRKRRKRLISQKYLDQIKEMPDSIFVEKFGLNKKIFRTLCRDLRYHTQLQGTIQNSVEMKVLCTLNFLATGLIQRAVGVTQNLPQRTTSTIIRQVIDALTSPHMLKNIKFPQTLEERTALGQEFERRFNMPGVIGCIDCTHVAINKPGDDGHLYFNGKGYHSLNVQIICDHNLRILNVNSKYGGATHKSSIWESSKIDSYLRDIHHQGEDTWLLGNTGYPLKPWLMTPVPDAQPESPEEEYNTRHNEANCTKRCFSLLKARWKCLLKDNILHYHPDVASTIVIACCVLHNLALEIPPPDDVDEYCGDGEIPTDSFDLCYQDDLKQGQAMRDSLLKSL